MSAPVIKATCNITEGQGNALIYCEMDDGSAWTCDGAGNNWKQVRLSIADLQTNFDAL